MFLQFSDKFQSNVISVTKFHIRLAFSSHTVIASFPFSHVSSPFDIFDVDNVLQLFATQSRLLTMLEKEGF